MSESRNRRSARGQERGGPAHNPPDPSAAVNSSTNLPAPASPVAAPSRPGPSLGRMDIGFKYKTKTVNFYQLVQDYAQSADAIQSVLLAKEEAEGEEVNTASIDERISKMQAALHQKEAAERRAHEATGKRTKMTFSPEIKRRRQELKQLENERNKIIASRKKRREFHFNRTLAESRLEDFLYYQNNARRALRLGKLGYSTLTASEKENFAKRKTGWKADTVYPGADWLRVLLNQYDEKRVGDLGKDDTRIEGSFYRHKSNILPEELQLWTPIPKRTSAGWSAEKSKQQRSSAMETGRKNYHFGLIFDLEAIEARRKEIEDGRDQTQRHGARSRPHDDEAKLRDILKTANMNYDAKRYKYKMAPGCICMRTDQGVWISAAETNEDWLTSRVRLMAGRNEEGLESSRDSETGSNIEDMVHSDSDSPLASGGAVNQPLPDQTTRNVSNVETQQRDSDRHAKRKEHPGSQDSDDSSNSEDDLNEPAGAPSQKRARLDLTEEASRDTDVANRLANQYREGPPQHRSNPGEIVLTLSLETTEGRTEVRAVVKRSESGGEQAVTYEVMQAPRLTRSETRQHGQITEETRPQDEVNTVLGDVTEILTVLRGSSD